MGADQFDFPQVDGTASAEPPAWFVVTSLGAFAAVVAGAYLTGSWVVGGGEPKRAASSTVASAAAGSAEAADAVSGFSRQGEEHGAIPCERCDWPGTGCEEGTCRLGPGSQWRLRPFALVGEDMAARPHAVCLREPGAREWTCAKYRGEPAKGADGAYYFYFPESVPAVVVAPEDLEGRGIEVRVNRFVSGSFDFEKVMPRDRIIASERLFKGGLVLPLGGEFLRLVVRVEGE